jgi:diguanylate cyclase (GGDEF)-like protein/PAS domain S-box-containing protein
MLIPTTQSCDASLLMPGHFTPTPLILLLVASAAVAFGLGVYALIGSRIAGSGTFGIIMAGVVAWSLCYALVLAGSDIASKTFWYQAEYLGVVIIPTGWFLFALRYTRSRTWLRRPALWLLAVEPCLILIVLWSSGLRGLIWGEITLEQTDFGTLLALDFGPVYWINSVYSLALVLAGTVTLGRYLLRTGHLYSRQAAALAIAALAPVVGRIVFSFGWSGRLDVTPFMFGVTGAALFWGFLHYGRLDLVPVARGAVFDALNDGVLVLDGNGRIVDLNRGAERLLSLPLGDGIGQRVDAVLPGIRADESKDLQTELSLPQSDGTERRLDVQVSAVRQGDRQLAGRLVVLRDVSALRLSEERFRAQFHNLPVPTYSWQHVAGEFILVNFNAAAEAATGGAVAHFLGRAATAMYALRPDILADLTRCIDDQLPFRREMPHQLGGTERVLDVTYVFVPPDLVTVHSEDVTERKEAELTLTRQALHDGLTGLPNRSLLRMRLQQALAAQSADDQSVALLLLDLDRFKEVNDTLGHQVGDALLQETASRLQGAVRTSDLVARLGGDEFAIVLHGANAAGATHMAETLVRVLQAPFVLEGQPLVVDASIGIAIAPEHGQDADTMVRCADVAMYEAKRGGTRVALYCAANDQHSPDRLALLGELQHAIDHDELLLHYQPKLDLRDGRLVGVEALVRWEHPERGFLPPSEFIPLVEQTGLIYPLSRWVLGAALQQQRAWRDVGIEVPVAVNLSRRIVHDLELPDMVAGALARWFLPADSLVLEITESSLMADPLRADENLRQLHALGVQISIDDFGTGYSSLASLKNLTVDELKIDQSFVQAMATDTSSRAIVRAAIDLADALNLRVVAEGVEDRATWDVLAGLGCDVAQGYFVCRPIAAAELEAWVAEVSPSWLAIAASTQLEDTLQERIRARGARLTAEEEFIARKRAEAALHVSEERNRLALQAGGMGTWDFDAVHHVSTWSIETEALCGLVPGAFEGTFAALQQSVHPADWPNFVVQMQSYAVASPQLQSIYRTVWPDGTVRWLENNGRAIFAADGTLLRVTGTSMDITTRKRAEAHDRLLTTALESSTSAVLLSDRQGYVEWANPAFTSMTGYTLSEVLGKSPRLLNSGGLDGDVSQSMWDTVVMAGSAWHGELTNRRKDGSLYTEEMTITPVRDDSGEITHFVAIKQDVTARKQSEKELARLAAIVTSSGDAIFACTLDGTVTTWNRGAERLYGYTAGRMIGQSLACLVPPERSEELTRHLAGIANGISVEHFETVRLREDGSRFDVSISMSPILDVAGQTTGAATIQRDITEQRQAQDALRERESQLNDAQRVAHLGSWEVDLATQRMRYSDEHFRIFGLEPSSTGIIAFEDAFRYVHPDDYAVVAQAVMNAITAQSSYSMELRIIRADGGLRWVQSRGAYVPDSTGGPGRVVGTGQDITERRHLEAEQSEARDGALEAPRARIELLPAAGGEFHAPIRARSA